MMFPSGREKIAKEKRMLPHVYLLLKKRYMVMVSIVPKRISVIPAFTISIYTSEESSSQGAIQENGFRFFKAHRNINRDVMTNSTELKMIMPGKPIWAKGELNKVKNGFPQWSKKSVGLYGAYLAI